MDQRQISTAVDNIYMLILAIVISNLNKGIKQFFLSEIVMLTTFTLYNFKKNNNLLLSMATSFFMVVFITLITIETSMISEAFDIISPTSNSKVGCLNITVKDLMANYTSESDLKRDMYNAGVPLNLYLTDANAPEIATYLTNTLRKKVSDTCV